MKNNLFLIRITLFSCLLLHHVTAASQESKTLTLQEAIDMSLKNSKQLKASKAKIDEAVAATREAMERRLPDASVSGSYLRVNKPDINIKTASAGGGRNDSSAIAPVNVTQAMYAMANVSLPVFAGNKIK